MQKINIACLAILLGLFINNALADECTEFLKKVPIFSQEQKKLWQEFKNEVASDSSFPFKFPRKYQTIATERLDIEGHLTEVERSYYKIIDDLIDEMRITRDSYFEKNLNERELALALLDEMSAKIVFRLGVKIIDKQQLLAHAFRSKVFDCDTLSIIFLSVGQALDLPIYGAVIPGHFYIKWKLSDGYINWESRTFQEFSEDIFRESECLPAPQIRPIGAKRSLMIITETDIKSYFFETLKSEESKK